MYRFTPLSYQIKAPVLSYAMQNKIQRYAKKSITFEKKVSYLYIYMYPLYIDRKNVSIFRIISMLQVDYKWTLGVYQFFIFKIEKVFYYSFLYLHVFMFGQKSILFTNKCKL